MSVSTENFIKTIYKLQQGVGQNTRPGTIATALGISNAAATDMARKLAARGLINYVKYQPITLTESGRLMAMDVLRKHRLWEAFLFEVFGLSMHEIHREAELLEHQTSDFLAEKIDAFLKNPTTDPHGDPIPEADGSIEFPEENIVLTEAPVGVACRVSRLAGSEEEFFDFCRDNKIAIGAQLTITNRYNSGQTTEIVIDDTKFLLNTDFTNLIYVKQNQ
ncbi:MAG: metal-dependent transcriptional regulator [Clostridia bacterium]|nr:metal-dependent transcriptional regulator [Clostridia bacterium]